MPPLSETYSRRRFLSALAVGAASGVASKEWSDSRKNEKPFVFNGTITEAMDKSYTEKIDYAPGLHKEYPPELLAQLQEFLVLQGQRIGSYSTGFSGEEKGLVNRSVVQTEGFNVEQSRKLQKKTWEVLKKILGDSHEYEEDYYIHALTYTFPRFLAAYGIFAKGLTFAQGDLDADVLTIEDILFRFYEIDRVVSTDLFRWGKQIRRDVVYINGVVPGIDQTQFDSKFPNSEAQTVFKNVLVFRKEYLRAGEEFSEQNRRGDFDAYKQVTLVDLVELLEEKGDSKEARMGILQILTYKKLLDEDLQQWQWTDRILEHETGHLVEQSDPRFAAYFSSASMSKFSAYQIEKFEKRTKDEMAALISELRYTENKLPSLKFALEWQNNALDKGYAYVKATQWIFDKIFAILCANPDAYGFQISSQIHLSIESQIMVRFVDFLDSPKFLDVMDLVKKDFEAMYATESFKKEIGDVFNIHPPVPSGTSNFLCTAATAAIAGSVAYSLLGFLQRKEEVKKQ